MPPKPSKIKSKEPQAPEAFWVFPGLVLGVWLSFLVFGWATEAVTRSKYAYTNDAGEEVVEKFKFTSTMTFWQCMANAIVAAVVLFLNHGSKLSFLGGVKLRDWSVVALGLFGAHKFGYGALAYIPFSLQVMVKSAKTVPVLIGGVLTGAKPSKAKVLEVLLLTFGITWFLYAEPSKKADSGAGFTLDSNTMYGMGMAVLALCCDGLYGPYQDKIVRDTKAAFAAGKTTTPPPSSWHMMFNANFWQALLCLPLCLIPGLHVPGVCEFEEVLAFGTRHPEIWARLLLFAASMAAGQSFIYLLARKYGSLTVTLTTTARKFASVLLSSMPPPLGMNNVIGAAQYPGIVAVFLSKQMSARIVSAVWGEEKKEKEHSH